jgi:hypothetical protein
MSKLTPEQKSIIREIEKQAVAAGLDPDYAVALASLESDFRNIPAQVAKGQPESTAFGPFQVNKATAQANGINYDEMLKDEKLAIQAGIKNILRHANNPNLMSVNPDTGAKEIDPMRIAAAHRYGEGSAYAKSGDTSLIDPVLREYLAKGMEHFAGESFPQNIYSSSKPEAKDEKAGTPSVDVGSMGSVPLGGYNTDEAEQSERYLGALGGLGLGTFLGTVKAPVWSAGSRILDLAKDFRKGSLNPQDVADMAEAVMKVKQSGSTPTGIAQTTDTGTPTGPYSKYTKKFDQNVGLTNQEIASATGMGKGEGEAWDLINKAKKANQQIAESYGSGWKLDPQTQLLVNTNAGSGPRNAPRQPMALNPTLEERAAQESAKYQEWVDKMNNARKIHSNAKLNPNPEASRDYRMGQAISNTAGKVGDVTKAVAQSSPVRWGLGGLGIGYNAENAYQQFGTNTPLGNVAGTTALGGALASGLSMVPKYASKANPAAIGLTTASNVMGDINKGDYESAKANAYLGGLGLASLPIAIGALLPSSTNKNEKKELERRRKMAPTITKP